MRGPSRLAIPNLVVASMLALSARPDAQIGLGCTLGASPLAFGNYSVFSGSAIDSAGTVTAQCAVGSLVTVGLSRGTAPSFAPRTLRAAGKTLSYNIYTNAGRTQVWGDGTAGTATQTILLVAIVPYVWQAYGRVPAAQDVPGGTYTDTVTASFVF